MNIERPLLDSRSTELLLRAPHGGNVSLAAHESGLKRTYLQKLVARHRR